jgi:hypothetical protein
VAHQLCAVSRSLEMGWGAVSQDTLNGSNTVQKASHKRLTTMVGVASWDTLTGLIIREHFTLFFRWCNVSAYFCITDRSAVRVSLRFILCNPPES